MTTAIVTACIQDSEVEHVADAVQPTAADETEYEG